MLIKIKIVSFVLALSLLGIFPQRGATEELPIVSPPTVEQHVQRIFGSQAKVAMAVLKAESGMRLDAKNWNCHYYREDGSRYSTSCKKEDRGKAHSVDCSIGQVNIRGTICPAHIMTLEGNMKEIERIYRKQGLNAWVVYKTGAYKKFL